MFYESEVDERLAALYFEFAKVKRRITMLNARLENISTEIKNIS